MKMINYLRKQLFIGLVLGLLISTNDGFTQDGSHQIDLPSPTASSFAKVAETPINLFKGTPKINIPIYTVAKNKLKVPISLSYDASGVRVQKIADWVGLNWRLNAGGVITRVMRGNPDEWKNGYLNTGDHSDLVNFQGLSSNEKYIFLTEKLNTLIDPEPDVFYYHFPGFSGKFLIAPDRKVYAIPQNDLKIEFLGKTGDSFSGFQITIPDGTKYVFTKIEKIVQTGDNITTPDYASAWYLTRVESAQGNGKINLKYNSTNPIVAHEMPLYEARYQELAFHHEAPGNVKQVGYTKYERVYLEEISTEDIKVTFSRSKRKDAKNPDVNLSDRKQEYKLDRLKVTEKSNNEKIKTADFGYSYHSNRLFLDEVQIEGTGSINSPPYQFKYINRDNLPDRFSFAVDYWGYYNGKTSNSSYIPPTYFRHPILRDRYYLGADRSVNPSTIANGTLNKITYPTGGYTAFEYEPHEYGSILYSNRTDLTKLDKASKFFSVSSVGDEDVFYFDIQNDIESETLVEINCTFAVYEGSDTYVRIYNDNTGEFLKAYNPSPDVVTGPGTGESEFKRMTDEFLLPDGKYRIVLKREDQDELISANLAYYEDVVVAKKIGGGIRLKKMVMNDGVSSTNNVVKTYQYGTENPGKESFGILYTEPDYDFIFGPDSGTATRDYSFYARISTPVQPFGSEGRRFLGYNKVIVNSGPNGSNGTVEHEFTALPSKRKEVSDLFSNWDHGVFMAQPDESYRFGLPKTKIVKNNDGEVQQRITNTYWFNDPPERLIPEVYKEFPALAYYKFGKHDFKFRFYKMYATWRKPLNKKNEFFGNSSSTSSGTRFIYSNADHKQLTRKVETNSEGSKRITDYTYAHQQYPEMKEAHMLSQPYKVTIKDEDGDIQSINWTLWKPFDVTGDEVSDFWHPCGKWIGGSGLGSNTLDDSACK